MGSPRGPPRGCRRAPCPAAEGPKLCPSPQGQLPPLPPALSGKPLWACATVRQQQRQQGQEGERGFAMCHAPGPPRAASWKNPGDQQPFGGRGQLGIRPLTSLPSGRARHGRTPFPPREKAFVLLRPQNGSAEPPLGTGPQWPGWAPGLEPRAAHLAAETRPSLARLSFYF